MPKKWKKGRGKLGFLEPLIGEWSAEAATPRGPIRCQRVFTKVLGGTRIRLEARWEFGPGAAYEELAIIGVGDDNTVCFWSFTSDGKRSQGVATDVADVHPEAIGFEAKMPAGIARMIYWPDDDAGFHWAVESKNKKGWHRFTEHHYRPAKAKGR
jgi:hypothetical protein